MAQLKTRELWWGIRAVQSPGGGWEWCAGVTMWRFRPGEILNTALRGPRDEWVPILHMHCLKTAFMYSMGYDAGWMARDHIYQRSVGKTHDGE